MPNTARGRRRISRLAVPLLVTTTATALLCGITAPAAWADTPAPTPTAASTAAAPKASATPKSTPAPASAPAKSPYTAAQLAMRSAMAGASTTAKKTKKPVTVAAATTMYSTIVANANGSFSFNENLAPQRVKQNNAWVPISTKLVAGTGTSAGTFHTKATVATITVSGGGKGPLTTEDDGSGHVVTTTWPLGALPKPKISGSTATYASVLPGVDLQLQTSALGVEDVLVVHSAAAAANPALATLKLGLSGTGLTVSATTAGGIQATDAKGNVDFTGPTPMMWDSAGATSPNTATTNTPAATPATAAPNTADALGAAVAGPSGTAHTAPMPVTVTAGTATMTPSRQLLTASSTVWPVYLDPQIADNQPEARTELWQCAADANTSFYDAANEGASNLNVNRVGWHTCGGDIRTLFQFDTSALDTSGNSPDGNGAIAISSASINLTTQYQCTPVDVWRTGPFNSATTWNDQNASGQAVWSGASILQTTSCNGNGAGQSWSINDYQQLVDAMNNGWTNITIGLRAHNEALQNSTTNYMAFYAVNSGGQDAELNVNFYEDPTVTGFSVGGAPIGNQGAQVGVCGTNSAPAYLPMTSTPPQMTVNVNDNLAGVTGHTLGIEGMYATGSSGYNWYGPSTLFGVDSSGNATESVPMPTGLVDGQTYTVAPDIWDQTVYGGTTLSIFPTPCTVKIASTPPRQPSFGATTFQATGQHLAAYNPVGHGGTITVNATAPTTPIARFDWVLNGPSTSEGAGKCSGITGAVCGSVTSSTSGVTGFGTTSAGGPIVIPAGAGNGEHWGDNYIYVSAVDAAGNISQFNRYDYFLSQAFQPVSFGNITGDGTPNLLSTDTSGNLIVYPTNLDPTGSVNAVQVAPAASAPNGASWQSALVTHRGAERVQPTDDLFAWDTTGGTGGNPVTGHMYYYLNSQQASATTQPGYVPPAPAPLNAFTQTQQAVVTRPACTPTVADLECSTYDPTWNSVQKILALGPVSGGCAITAPTTACKTTLLTVESYNGGPAQLWMFSPAGVGQLRNPVLLSTSQPGWDWSQMTLFAPGNAAGHPGGEGGLPDLWAVDPSGTLWQFTNHSDTGGPGAGLGTLSAKVQLGATGQFTGLTIDAVGDLTGGGNPDLWVMNPEKQISVLVNPFGTSGSSSSNLTAAAQDTATGIGWANTANVSTVQGHAVATTISGQVVLPDISSGTGNQKCLDDLNGSTANGTVVDEYDCNGTYAQQWTFDTDGTIRPMGTTPNPSSPPTVCLDTSGSLLQNAPISLQGCDLTNRKQYQTWQVIPSLSTPGAFQIYNPGAGMCLDDTNYSTINASQFQLYPCWDAAGTTATSQLFRLPGGPGTTQAAEGESVWATNSGGSLTLQTGSEWSNNAQEMLVNTVQGSSVTFNDFVPNAGTYAVTPVMTKADDYGQVTVSVDGTTLPNVFDGYGSGVTTQSFDFGAVALAAGNHSITFTVTGTNAASVNNRYNAGVDSLDLVPASSTAPVAALTLTPATGSAPLQVTASAAGSIGGAAGISSYTFDFGDGTVVGPQSGSTASHTYAAIGTYTVTLTVTDTKGGSATSTALEQVNNTPPPPSVAYVTRNATAATTATVTSIPIPVTTASSAGDALLVSVYLSNEATCVATGTGAATATDTKGNAYQVLAAVPDTKSHCTLILGAFKTNALTTSDTITIGNISTTKYQISVDEVAGVDHVDQTSTGTGPIGGTTFSTGNVTTTSSNEMLFAALGYNSPTSGTTTSFNGSWNTSLAPVAVSSYKVWSVWQVVTATGTYSATGSTTAGWGAAIVALNWQ